jgi:isopentenyl-diphosphate delta-isomerase
VSDTKPARGGGTNEGRKQEHLDISLGYDVSYKGISTGLKEYAFLHQALPELNMEDLDLSVNLFDKRLAAPLVISPMVGGIESAAGINRNLAGAAQSLGLAMGVGSQRCMIDDPSLENTFKVREVAPGILLFANLGAVQMNYGYGIRECQKAVESIGADALVLHLNPLQEAFQPEGNTDFSSLLRKIEIVCRELPVPVIVKEVGSGISDRVARLLQEVGVAGIDVAGAGGTSWSRIEGIRAGESAVNLAADFDTWGIPTADSIRMARQGAPGLPLIASGGIRNGLDVAKAIALGADAAGMALCLLRPATVSAEAVVTALQEVIEVLKIAMFCIGAADISQLKNTPFLVKKERG